jgi:hypothetical protein
LALVGSSALVRAAKDDAKTEVGKVAGILFDRKDDWLTVKGDGDKEPVKYVIAKGADKKLLDALKTTFGACRVELTYKKDGDTRQLLSIRRQILKASGMLTGAVVKVHGDFWVEVKPKDGVADAFAPGANYKDKNFMAKLKGVKPGETVTIAFYTDFERHRILSLRTSTDPEPDKPIEFSSAGLIIEKKNTMMSFKEDWEDEPSNYFLPDGAEKRMVDAFQTIFHSSRVQLRYKIVGDKRILTAFQRQLGRPTGTVTGEVIANHGAWIEVKPADDLVDGYMPHFNKDSKAIEATMKELKKGDIVTIKYTTDFERRRIESLEKKEK